MTHLALPLIVLGCLLAAPLQAQQAPTPVTTAPLAQKSFFKAHSAPAATLSLNESLISAETSGRVASIAVRIGDTVAQATLLATLACRDNQLQLQQAQARRLGIEARAMLARQQIKRSQSLRKQRNVSQERLDQQQADLKSAQADLQAQTAAIEQAQLNVERCQIRAPFAGVVTARRIGEGSWTTPGQPLFELIDSERLEISAQIAIDQIDSLSEARDIVLETNNGQYPLTLQRLVPVVASRGRNREARLIFRDQAALPGTSGRLVWHSRLRYVEADIPQRRGEQMGLFLLEGDQTRFHPLPAAQEGQPARVNLPEETQLIIEGRHALQDGDPVAPAH